jgi:cysteinyl-tRNA synthetase
MTIKLFNTLTREKEVFKPLQPSKASIYSCGPTVYNYAHIGNWRSFLVADFLHRTLEFFGYQVKHVMNITDVGHLTSDEDTGEDKVEEAARQAKKTAKEISEYYLQAFLRDRQLLNILSPTVLPRATEHIPEMIELIKILEKNGYTYFAEDGIYFDTSKFPTYGKLSGQSLEEKKAGARVKVAEGKKHPTDFALWKFSPSNQKRQQEWDSPWGKGFPGWHIECSALSTKYLGQPFDIHTGGVDHIGVHHENEIAQSEAAYGKPLANYWLHVEFLQVKEEKMAKSAQNFYLLEDLSKKGYHPLAFRLLILSAHYQSKQNFSWEALEQAQNNLERIYSLERRLLLFSREEENPKIEANINLASYKKDFFASLADNLNTPQALAVLFNLLKEIENSFEKEKLSSEQANKAYQLLLDFDQVLGLEIQKRASQEIKVPPIIQELVKEREEKRENKDWKEADRLRARIESLGYQIEDTSKGPRISPLKFLN